MVFVALFLILTKLCLPLPYCATPESSNCVPCPLNSECEGYKLVCDDGFKESRGACVDDPALENRARDITAKFERYLAELLGNHLCGKSQDF